MTDNMPCINDAISVTWQYSPVVCRVISHNHHTIRQAQRQIQIGHSHHLHPFMLKGRHMGIVVLHLCAFLFQQVNNVQRR